MSSDFRVVAIIAAYNEADIIEHVVGDLIDQGIQVYLLDDGSTDRTIALVERYLGRGVLGIERLADTVTDVVPAGFEWERILLRKTQLAAALDADWFIHHDADEFRESPWPHLSLRDAIRRVDRLGFNAIDFSSLDFWPVHDEFRAGDDVRHAFTFYAEPAPHDRVQIRSWKKAAELVDLVSSGGHDVQFPGRSVFPIRFILRHYPIRGQAHGERKVFEERRNRFLDRERARGWHVQYDDVREGESFIREASTLTPYDPDALRLALNLRHRDVEALEESLNDVRSIAGTCRSELDSSRAALARTHEDLARTHEDLARAHEDLVRAHAELARTRADLEARNGELARTVEAGSAEIAGLRDALGQRATEVECWRASVEDLVRRLDAFERSLSWRWTSPARAAYRLLRGQ